MKKNFLIYFFIFSLIVFAASCNQKKSKNNEQKEISTKLVNNPNSASGKTNKNILPKFKFDEEVHDFGKVIQGEQVSFAFRFKNIGKSDLLISAVSTSCGCTISKFPKFPIHPGEKNIIYVKFNSEGKKGFQNKSIIIVANTQPNTKVLRIKAQVINPEE